MCMKVVLWDRNVSNSMKFVAETKELVAILGRPCEAMG